MKKIIAFCFVTCFLSACSIGEFTHSTEPRSNVYYGQPVADLYENFGTPTKATQLSENERVLIYITQKVEKDWAYRYLRGCVMRFHLRNERVIDWSSEGNACVVQNGVKPKMIQQTDDEFGLFDSDINQSKLSNTDSASIRSVTAPKIESYGSTGIAKQLPADAFDGRASTVYYKKYAPSQMPSLPADAFDKGTPTNYRMKQGQQTQMFPMAQQVPADAFHGKASTIYGTKNVSQTVMPEQTDYSDDEWGLFD